VTAGGTSLYSITFTLRMLIQKGSSPHRNASEASVRAWLAWQGLNSVSKIFVK